MTQMDQPMHSPPPSGSPPKRPKGILKNRSSSNVVPPLPATTPPEITRPETHREMSEREVVLANTLHNAGHRRSTSRGTASSRRQSGVSRGGSEAGDGDHSPRLQWDEANLYLAEQEREAMGARMKIDEPKTPFAKQYDPAVDEAEVGIDPDNLMVDEVDKKLMMERDKDIPDLDIGGPEMEMQQDAQTPEAERRVIVEEGLGETNGDKSQGVRHGEEGGYVSEEEREKHRKFEEMRKKHYEMKSIKNLLGHPEQIEDVYDDEDEDMENPPPPPAPRPADAVNGQ